MAETALARQQTGLPQRNGAAAEAVELALVEGDLSGLNPVQRLEYYNRVCDSLGLNPYTKPFEYIKLNGKLVLYAKRDCADQLRSKRGVSVRILDTRLAEGVYIVTAEASDASGRVDTSIGAVATKGLQGEALANALMKTETKAKRRVTLSFCGLGILDETEVETIPGAVRVTEAPARQVNRATGEVTERVTGATEQERTFSGATGCPGAAPESSGDRAATASMGGLEPTIPQLKLDCNALLKKGGYPEPGKPKPYFEAVLGRPIAKLADLDLDAWMELRELLQMMAASRVACFANFGKWCKREGHNASDRAFRLATFGEVLGRTLTTTSDLLPEDWSRLDGRFCALLQDAEPEVMEAEIVTPPTGNDPFEEG